MHALKRLPVNRFSLRFNRHFANLEPSFQQNYLEKTLNHIRISLFLGVLLISVFGLLDAILIPTKKHLIWLIRYAIICPPILLVILFSRFQVIQQNIQPILSSLIVISGGGIIFMILIAPPPVNYSYYAGLILIFFFGYTFMRAQFIWATLGAWIVVFLYEISATVVSHTPLPILINNNFFFIGANIIGMLACYSIEYFARRDFLLVQLLEAEQAKVQSINQDLEQRAEARTKQLEQTNRELAIEIRERKSAEAERIRLAEQLKQAEKMEAIGSLAAGVAHDLNNLLSGLVSYPELLLLDIPENSPLRKSILTIQKSGEKAAAIVQDLLTLARRGVTTKKVVNPNQLISDYLDSPEFLNLKKSFPHVRYETALEPGLLNVVASPVQFSKTMMNLISNAAEALLINGTVNITTTNCYIDQSIQGYEIIAEGEYALISVGDTGVGIAQKDLKKIFEPFFTKKRMGRSGTGLGMSVVWSTVKDMSGFVDILSKEGYGTTFKIYLPVTRQTTVENETPVTIDDYRGTESILVVDDIFEQREIAASMLKKLGYQVATVRSGESALTYLHENQADIVILDMIMDPGMDGCETYRRILKINPTQKAIVASGYSETERVREVQRLGAGVYLKKPYTLEKIAMAVRGELGRPLTVC